MNHTPRLALPLIHSGQAQKEITHNEALLLLDILTNPVVQKLNVTKPPGNAQSGELFIIGTNPSREFAEHPNELALKLEHDWRFTIPRKWMEVTLDADGSKYCWNGRRWIEIITNQKYQPFQEEEEKKEDELLEDEIPVNIGIQKNMLINKESGEYLQICHQEEQIDLQGENINTTIQIPHHSIVIAVNIRVLEEIVGANSFSVGVANNPQRYGNNISTATDTTNIGITTQMSSYWQDTPLQITASNDQFTSGKLHITIQYFKPHGPWNWD